MALAPAGNNALFKPGDVFIQEFGRNKERMCEIIEKLKMINEEIRHRQKALRKRASAAGETGAAVGMLLGVAAAPFTGALGLGLAVGAAAAVSCSGSAVKYEFEKDRIKDQQMVHLANLFTAEFVDRMKSLRKNVKYVKRSFQLLRKDTERLSRMETHIEDLISTVRLSSSETLQQCLLLVTAQCERTLDELETLVEDIETGTINHQTVDFNPILIILVIILGFIIIIIIH